MILTTIHKVFYSDGDNDNHFVHFKSLHPRRQFIMVSVIVCECHMCAISISKFVYVFIWSLCKCLWA